MPATLNRREFLLTPMAFPLIVSAAPGPAENQTFRVGYAPEFGLHPAEQSFWTACDACSRLGFHYVETNNSGVKIVQAYADRTAEFKEKMSKRNLTMMAFAVVSEMVNPNKRQQVMEENLQVGRFLQAVGGKYINLIFDVQGDPNLSREKLLQQLRKEDFQRFTDTANEIGNRLRSETGIHLGYHPEKYEIKAKVVDRILEMTNPDYVDFLPDVGHITAGGGNPLEMYQKHRSRMIATHFKDWNPDLAWDRNEPGERGKFVALGKGIVNFPALVAFLRQTKFAGQVMVELDEQPNPKKEMKDYVVKKLGLSLA
jgi:sugar phosphate isomerase/epimerase